jgi:hypothetical protein
MPLKQTQKQLSLDLCIVMDTTSSMSRWVEEAKKSCKQMLHEIREEVKKIKPNHKFSFRFGFVGYKDFDDGPDHITALKFSTEENQFQDVLDRISVSGGGDWPEDVAGALDAAEGLDWNTTSDYKVLVHFFDAPPHGSNFHDLAEKDDSKFNCANDVLASVRNLAEKRVNYVMFRCGDSGMLMYTSKYAGLCEETYVDYWDEERVQMTDGRKPTVTNLELNTNVEEHVASRFINLVVSASVCEMAQKVPSYIALAAAGPTKSLSACVEGPRSVPAVFPRIKNPSLIRRLFPNAHISVSNQTEHTLYVLIFPSPPKFENRLSDVQLKLGMESVGIGFKFAHILNPENRYVSELPIPPKGNAAADRSVFTERSSGAYLSVCRRDVPGLERHLVIVGGQNIFVPKGKTLVLEGE